MGPRWDESTVARLRHEFELERQADERRAKDERFGAPAIFGPVCTTCEVPLEYVPETGFWRHLGFEGACGLPVVTVSEVAR